LLDLLAYPRQSIHRGVDHRAPPPRVPTDLVEDDAVVFSFNDLQGIVRTPRQRTLLAYERRRTPRATCNMPATRVGNASTETGRRSAASSGSRAISICVRLDLASRDARLRAVVPHSQGVRSRPYNPRTWFSLTA
jgi:hypothetical protein